MKQIRLVFSYLFFFYALPMIGQQTVQLTEVPPKPTCTFKVGACNDLWNAYDQALSKRRVEELQLYIDRQKQIASEAATAPLQQQIADLTKLATDQQGQITKLTNEQAEQVAKLQKELQDETSTANLSSQADVVAAREQGIERGLEYGVGGMFALWIVVIAVTKLRVVPK